MPLTPSPEAIAAMRPAISAGWFYVPYEAIGNEAAIQAERRRLTYKSRYADKSDTPIRMFKDLPSKGYLGVPRTYGKLRWAWLPYTNEETEGLPMIDMTVRLPDPNHHRVKEPLLQAKFMGDMDRAILNEKCFTAYATTGSGKTVVGARSAAIRHRKTCILVPLERLMDQWRAELIDKLGVPEHRIGIVQQDTCEFADKDYVIGMMPSLGGRRYPAEFYQSIGTVIVDEAHRIGTASLAMTPALFAASVRVALSATPERSDGSSQPIFWHIGPIKVSSEATAVHCDVYVDEYDDGGYMASFPPLIRRPGEPKKSDHGFRIKKLTQDDRRNRKLASNVFRLWKAGRKVLAIGEHVGHVQLIRDLCVEMGMPMSATGQCTGERHKFKVGVRDGKRVRELIGKSKVSAADFKLAKENADVVFATYGCFKEGIDEPRLDAGVDLTPVGKAKQVIGRVRRPFEGKTNAIWITIVDLGDWMSMRYWKSRQRDYVADAQVRVIFGKLGNRHGR